MPGRIFDIQRFAIHDGPGIRTTVFLKGCPLRCKWCHNPEGISPAIQLSYDPARCIGCGECAPLCPNGALGRNASGRMVLERSRCDSCGRCAPACDPAALSLLGRDASVQDVMPVVLRDREYYRASGGGMTLSGGEPLAQPAFAQELLQAARSAQIHTAVETSGAVDWSAFSLVLPHVNLFLFDYKETDPLLHEGFTGLRNEPILENLRRLHDAGASILLRCPLIPEHNARREHLEGIARTAHSLPRLLGVELLPYHRLGRSKLERLGFRSRMPDSVAAPGKAEVDGWISFLRDRQVRLVNPLPGGSLPTGPG